MASVHHGFWLALFGFAAAAPGHAASTTPTLVTEPAQGLSQIYSLITSATSTIDMTMYELTDTTAQNDLCTAAGNGVTVRVILDVNLEKSNNTNAYNQLQACGVNVVWANTRYAATHEKSIVVDAARSSARAAIMTLNLTSRYYSTSRDFALIETNASDIAAIESTFNKDFNHTSVTPSTGADLVWSPTNAQSALLGVINGAKQTLVIENEEMSDTAIVDALKTAAGNGVAVTVVMTDNSAYQSELDALSAAGVKIGTYPDNSSSLYIHAKVIVADQGLSGQKAFLGSENFSSASLTRNRELGLITTSNAIVSSLQTTLLNDYAGSTPWQ